ncbi:MAG: hypothetical protein FWD66_10095 [Paludibacter sp.]|nr:hypothetical protein [Paludibacter sp.]
MSYAGTPHWNEPGRIEKRLQALDFFRKLWELPIEHICIENPKGCASPIIAKYSQIIQPYYFGEPFYKTTCLWLKNLPKLTYENKDTLFEKKSSVEPTLYYVNSGSRYTAKMKDVVYKGTSNSKKRALTFQGIANAMADKWTEYFIKKNN